MADQLWQKGAPLDAALHAFTVGSDPQTDLALVPYDLYGTAAHVRMLAHVGLFDAADAQRVVAALARLLEEWRAGRFTIAPEQEDCHTAIEQALTAALGDAGKNVHLGRSRNDQVLTALRLYLRDSAFVLAERTAALAAALLACAERWPDVALPGYTHLRRAMPSSIGLWAGAYAAALAEELEALQGVLLRLDRCPLGSGAGFGTPLPLDRAYSAQLLGFSRVQANPLDAANSRGRDALALAGWVSGVGNALEKLLWDLALYSTEEFGFISLPDAFTTGSSIMPQKRNPDVVELARGRCAQLRAWRDELERVATALPGSYHRDFQLQKEPLLRSVNGGLELLDILARLVPGLVVDPERCAGACTPEIYATQEAYRRALSGKLPFREAYAAVGKEVLAGRFTAPVANGEALPRGNSRHIIDELRAELDELARQIARQSAAMGTVLDRLLQ
jgi:argininosuccinate lyase